MGTLIGQTGTGKSELARQLLPRSGDLAILDPKRRFRVPFELAVYDDPRVILKKKPKRFIYRPSPGWLNNQNAWDAIYRHCYERGNIFVYTDDVVGVLSRTKPPEGLTWCYQMGRERGVSMMTATQRPVLIPGFIMSEATKVYVFRLRKSSDIELAEEWCPGYNVETLRKAVKRDPVNGKHWFYYYDADTMTDAVTALLTLPEVKHHAS